MITNSINIFAKILAAIAIILLLGIPAALKNFPNPDPRIDLWNLSNDALYSNYRIKIIVAGLILTAAAIITLTFSFIKYKKNPNLQILNITLFMLIFTLGSIDYIYWAFGHFILRVDSFYGDPPILKTITYFTARYWTLLMHMHTVFLYLITPIFIFRYSKRLILKKGELLINLLILISSILIVATSYQYESDYWFWVTGD